MAIAHPHNKKVTEVIFRKKYGGKRFEVNGKHFYKPDQTFDFETTLSALQVFGHLLTTLTIDYDILNEVQSNRVNEHLSKYAGDSLVEVELKGCSDRYLKGLKGPFRKAEKISLRDGSVKSTDINFADIFPSARELDVEYMSCLSPESIAHRFPRLESLSVEYLMASDSPLLEQRLKLNTQLKSLSLHGGNLNGLKMLSMTLPHLETLIFKEFNGRLLYFDDDIHLEQVKVFGIKVTRQFRLSLRRIPIIFGNLLELSIDVPENSVWFDVILANKHLKKLVTGHLSDEVLRQISDLEDLEDFQTEYKFDSSNSINNVVRFIENSRSLKRATFYKSNNDIRAAILSRLYGWQIVESGNDFTFTRK